MSILKNDVDVLGSVIASPFYLPHLELSHISHISTFSRYRAPLLAFPTKGTLLSPFESHVLEIDISLTYRSIHLLLSHCHFSKVSTHTDSPNIPASRRGIFLGRVEYKVPSYSLFACFLLSLKHSAESIPIPFLRLTVPINFPYSTN